MNSPKRPPQVRQRGFTIVEIMVALVIGLIVLAGVVQIFVATKQSSKLENALSQVQENGRFAIQFLTRDIRGAGFWGCKSTTPPNDNVNTGGSIDLSKNSVTGTDGTTDTITLRGASGSGLSVQTPYMTTSSAALHVGVNNGLAQGDILIVSDCSTTDIFQITNANPDTTGTIDHDAASTTSNLKPGNATKNLSKTYAGDAQIYSAHATTYSIVVAKDSLGNPLTDSGNNNIYALQRAISSGSSVTTQTLVDGVDDMQIEYGVDTDGDGSANYYVNAGGMPTDASGNPEWSEVVSVRVALLVQSTDNMARSTPYNNKSFTLLDKSVGPFNDRYVREVFTTTIALRNHAS